MPSPSLRAHPTLLPAMAASLVMWAVQNSFPAGDRPTREDLQALLRSHPRLPLLAIRQQPRLASTRTGSAAAVACAAVHSGAHQASRRRRNLALAALDLRSDGSTTTILGRMLRACPCFLFQLVGSAQRFIVSCTLLCHSPSLPPAPKSDKACYQQLACSGSGRKRIYVVGLA